MQKLGRENRKLDWALDKEYGFDHTEQVQMFEGGIMWKGSSAKVYELLNDDRFFAK